MTTVEIVEFLRRRIIADVHLGRLKPGGRLPSLRIVAREIGASIRAVAHAYNELEREGLVNVKGRSGIYLVLPPSPEPELSEPYDWYVGMLKHAWERRIPLDQINDTVQKLVTSPLCAGCVESTEDHMVAFCAELEEDFALRTISIKLTPEGARIGDRTMTLEESLGEADFAVTTAFHAADVREVADRLGIPVVIVSMNDTLVDALERELENKPVTVVADDPAFVGRMRDSLVERFESSGELRVVSMADLNGNRPGDDTTLLYTRAARKRLNAEEFHLLPPPIPFVSATAARKILQYMLNAVVEPSE